MRSLLLILFLPLCCFAQYDLHEKLPFKATIISDSATIKGYYVISSDSTVILSQQKRYSLNSTISVPVNTIKEMHLKNQKIYWVGVAAAAVLGFTVTAGLSNHAGDIDNDGKTSFWELLFSAIEGTTSSDKRRRNTALIVGAVGGTAGLLLGMFADKKISLVFPLSNRNNYYSEKKFEINKFVGF